jgi:hypothetical protein
MSRLTILSHQYFPFVISPYLSLRCTPLVRPTLEIHVSWLHLFFHVFLWLCALDFIWTPRVTCEKRHVSWLYHTLHESSNSIDCCAPLWNQCSQLSLCAHQPTCLLDQCAPCLVLFLVLIVAFYITVVLSITITLHGQICNAQPTTCRHNFNYTKGSKFESNLNTVLNNLVQDTSQTGFNTSEYGQSLDQIYGLLQCRGDTTVDQCYNCSQQANTTLRQNCGNASGGLIWFDDCFLRYENYSFFGQLDTTDNYGIFQYK